MGSIGRLFGRHIGAAALLAGLILAAQNGCGNSTEPDRAGPTLAGDWNLIGYADHGVQATATGSASFRTDGSFTIAGEVTFPEEPVDTLAVTGTWSMNGDRAYLATVAGADEWRVVFVGTEATLTRIGPEPANVIQLRRR